MPYLGWVILFIAVLWHCCLADRKGIWSVKTCFNYPEVFLWGVPAQPGATSVTGNAPYGKEWQLSKVCIYVCACARALVNDINAFQNHQVLTEAWLPLMKRIYWLYFASIHWFCSKKGYVLFSFNSSRHFRKSFPCILLWHFCSHRTRFRGLCNSFTILATLKIVTDIDMVSHAIHATVDYMTHTVVLNWCQILIFWATIFALCCWTVVLSVCLSWL